MAAAWELDALGEEHVLQGRAGLNRERFAQRQQLDADEVAHSPYRRIR